MKAMLLAAGRGLRMGALTERRPKPLLQIGGKPLIEHHLERLVAAGFQQIVINVSWLGEQIEEYLSDGSRWGCDIQYSWEPEPLETAGGIQQALPLLGEQPFALINGDVWTDYDFRRFHDRPLAQDCLARLVLVDNPDQHRGGDFQLQPDGHVEFAQGTGDGTLTYAGMGVYHPDLLAGVGPGFLPLRELFQRYAPHGRISGEHFRGDWEDVGTPERLAALDERSGIL